jgi:hypothetical protein
MAKVKQSDLQQFWAEAQRRCRLSDEAARMANKLGLSPRSLIKHIPSLKPWWKAPVKDRVRDLYQKRYGPESRRAPSKASATLPQAQREP